MATNRQERFLMRQRGAGARQIQDFGFDIPLPGAQIAPLAPVRSGRARRTPQPDLQPQRSSRRTPKLQTLMSQRSSRQTPKPAPLAARRSTGRTPATTRTQRSKKPTGVDNARTKEGPKAVLQPVPSTDLGSVRKKRKLTATPSSQNLQLGEADVPTDPHLAKSKDQGGEPSSQDASAKGEGRNIRPADNDLNESEFKRATLPAGKKRKKRKSIGQTSRKRVKVELPTVQESSPLPTNSPKQTTQLAERPEQRRATSTNDESIPAETSSKGPLQKSRRKKRKSIGKIPKKRKVSLGGIQSILSPSIQQQDLHVPTSTTSTPASLSKRIRNTRPPKNLSPPGDKVHEAESASQTSSQDPPPSSIPERKKRGRPRKSPIPAPTQEKTPRVKRPPAPKTKRPKASSTRPTPRVTSSSSVPIAIHRLAHPPNTTTSSLSPLRLPTAPNAADVLSQITSETLTTTTTTTTNPSTSTSTTHHRALYHHTLSAHLLSLSTALAHEALLRTHLRRAGKKQAALRKQLVELRREKSELMLRGDRVRGKEEREAEGDAREEELERVIRGVRGVVERGREREGARRAGGGEEGFL
ncbi:Mucin-21 [Loxospora ochrophaea]|nr:Mucin-21 [Loxospora ochrophaea]